MGSARGRWRAGPEGKPALLMAGQVVRRADGSVEPHYSGSGGACARAMEKLG